METFRRLIKEKSLTLVMLVAIVARLLSVIFSQGYGMHDDHFLVIEAPFSWSEGKDYAGWLPWNQGSNPVPSGHSLLYPGINYLLFVGFKYAGISDPKIMMFFIRLILAVFSLITVYTGYRIVEKLSDKKTAFQAGMMLAALWFMPFFSVRNLVEFIVIPFFALGFLIIVKEKEYRHPLLMFMLAGFVTGIGISIRYQSVILVGGIGLALLLNKKIVSALVYGTGALIAFVIVQGGIDLFIWGRPFAEFLEYVHYNILAKDAYGTDNVWMYLELLAGLLIPPVSIFLFLGFFRVWRKYLILFLPVFLFILFHTFFSNRQERFILPVLPFFVIAGILGWNEMMQNHSFLQKHIKTIRKCFIFFWFINIILLIPVSLSSTKKSRIDAMHYFYPINKDVKTVIIEDSGRKSGLMMPVFYSGKTLNTITILEDKSTDLKTYQSILPTSYLITAASMRIFYDNKQIGLPQFIVFIEDIELEKRVEYMKKYFPDLKHVHTVKASFLDRLMRTLNPANKNETFYIYKTGK